MVRMRDEQKKVAGISARVASFDVYPRIHHGLLVADEAIVAAPRAATHGGARLQVFRRLPKSGSCRPPQGS